MFWKGILTGGRNETPDNPMGWAPFGAASAKAEALEGLGKKSYIVRTESRLIQPEEKCRKNEKSVHSPLIKEGRFHFPDTKQAENLQKTQLTPMKKYSKIENALRGTDALCKRKVTAKKLTLHSACFIEF